MNISECYINNVVLHKFKVNCTYIFLTAQTAKSYARQKEKNEKLLMKEITYIQQKLHLDANERKEKFIGKIICYSFYKLFNFLNM